MRSWSQRRRGPGRAAASARPPGPTRAAQARRLDLHQRDQAVDLGLVRAAARPGCGPRRSASSQSAGPHPVVAGGRGVALVEHEIDHLEHRGQPRASLRRRAAPRTARSPRRACAWRARSAARRSAPRTRNARAISSVVRPPSRRSVSATRASVESTGWQAMNIEAQQVVADVVVERGVEVGLGSARPSLELVAELARACARARPAAQHVDRAVLGGGHQPGARVVRDA